MPLGLGKNSWCPLNTDPLVPAFSDVGVKQCSDSVILNSKTRKGELSLQEKMQEK